jgi:hypothetical protein
MVLVLTGKIQVKEYFEFAKKKKLRFVAVQNSKYLESLVLNKKRKVNSTIISLRVKNSVAP